MNTNADTCLSIRECVRLACVLEATACKPGNVHPTQRFADLTYLDFVLSADAVAPMLERTAQIGVGAAVRAAIQATRQVVATNTNLGIVLLLAPLAAVPRSVALARGVAEVLNGLTVADARDVYAAIRLAQPGGLGHVAQADVQDEPQLTLLEVMRLATERDGVARQYALGFQDVFQIGLPALAKALEQGMNREDAIVTCHLELLAALPDTLIARKRGRQEAVEAAARARTVLDAGGMTTPAGQMKLEELDAWLRAEGHSRNPGTTADLVAACLFAALRDGTMKMSEFQARMTKE